MLIEIHMIQNHSPSNLNRDDLGAPKTCLFGGVTRARISSQCLKRSIRHPGNPDDMHKREPGMFAKAMKGYIGLRTKLFPWLVGQVLDDPSIKGRFLAAGTAVEDYANTRKAIIAACKGIAKKEKNEPADKEKKGKKDDRPQTPQLIFLGPGHARRFVDELLKAQPEHRKHFLDPKTVFESLLENELGRTGSLTEEQRERALEAGWRIRNTEQRMKELEQVVANTEEGDTESPDAKATEGDNNASPETENQEAEVSDEKVAQFIARALDILVSQNVKDFESITSSRGRKGGPKLAAGRKEPPKYADFMKSLAAIPCDDAVDIALFGRMTTSDAFQDVEAAMQVAHAISTHAGVTEVDYFTAVDDLGKGVAAGHVDEAMYNSACFYKYFCLDWGQLVRNLTGPEPDKKEDPDGYKKWKDETEPQAKRLAACTLGHFIRAAAMTTPSGKQNSFASHTEPCGVLVEIKEKGRHPTSYANAFAEPVERIGKWDDDGPDCVSLEGRSIAQFGDHIFNLRRAYGIDSTLLWHAMPMYRFPLQGWERDDDGRKKRDEKGRELPPVSFKEWDRKPSDGAEARKHRSCARIDGDKDEGLVEAVIDALHLGFLWSEVMNDGKEQAATATSPTVET
jgi:hypothetical protein